MSPPETAGRASQAKPLSVADVNAGPIVSYTVSAVRGGDEMAQHFETEDEAIAAARMLAGSGATGISVDRWTTRVVEVQEPVQWDGA
jgi:hypothetical protein